MACAHVQLAALALAAGDSCRESAFEKLASMTNDARSPPESSYVSSLENIQPGSSATCGATKCYVPSATKDRTGYLLYRYHSNKTYTHPPVSWMYASCLASRYGIKHLLLAPEERVEVSTQMMSRLSSMDRTHYKPKLRTEALAHLHARKQMVVQKVRTFAPSGLLVGCFGAKGQNTRASLPAFARTATSAHAVSHLNASLESTRLVLLNEGCLTGDVQFIVSTDGDVIHIDLDRGLACDNSRGLTAIDSCFRALVSRLDALVHGTTMAPPVAAPPEAAPPEAAPRAAAPPALEPAALFGGMLPALPVTLPAVAPPEAGAVPRRGERDKKEPSKYSPSLFLGNNVEHDGSQGGAT